MQIEWMRCKGGDWCSLNDIDLENSHFDNLSGVYIIWCGKDGECIKVGQGDIRDRFTEHRSNPKIQCYSSKNLLCTWAHVSEQHMDGVEKYIADTYKPRVAKRFPNVAPIPVNSPFE